MDKLKIVKAIVFILTFMIILGFIMLAVGLMNGVHKKKGVTFDNEQLIDTVRKQEVWLGENSGSSIKDVLSCGDNICIVITNGGICDRIYVVNNAGDVLQKVYVGKDSNEPVSASDGN